MLSIFNWLLRGPVIGRQLVRHLASSRGYKYDPPAPYDLQLDFSAPLIIPDYEGYQSAKDVLTSLSDAQRTRLECLRVQLDLQKSAATQSSCLPDGDKIFDKQWLELLACPDPKSLNRTLYKIYHLQVLAQKDPMLKVDKAPSATPIWSVEDTSHFYRARLAAELVFSDTIIIDLAFESVMSPKTLASFCQEMRHLIRVNRESRQPFRLHMFGPDLDGSDQLAALFRVFFPGGFFSKESREKGMLAVMNERLPYDFSDGCFSSYLPSLDKTVYIVPDSRYRLHSYDPSKTYIIPGYPHRLLGLKSVALKRARSLGLQCYAPPGQSLKPKLSETLLAMLALKNGSFFTETSTQGHVKMARALLH